MKRSCLVVLIVCIGFIATGCAKEEAATGAGTEGGVLGSTLSERGAVGGSAAEVISPKIKITGDALMVADFNSGTKPSNIGGDFGAWDRDPADFTQTCEDSFDPVHRYGRDGFGMRLHYDVDSSNPAYNGFWMKLNGLDASGFKNLVFYVKGDKEAGYTAVFKVELKNTGGEVGKFYVSGVDSEWKEICVPLNRFHGIRSFNSLTEFVVVFEDYIATDKDGVIYIDDIRFTR